MLSNQAERDEVVQEARRVLLVGSPDGAPKIGTYLGQGPLKNWVAVVAIRWRSPVAGQKAPSGGCASA